MDPLVFLHDHWAEGAFGYKVLHDDAWPVVKRLWDRYRDDKPETIAKATSNATDLAHRFEAQVIALRDAHVVTDDQIRKAMESPAFAQALQQAFIDGSETTSEFKHEQLATLVAMQLTADGESFQSVALRIAAERMKHLTERHLRELGLMFAMGYHLGGFDVDDAADREEVLRRYFKACEDTLQPFADTRLLYLDLNYMEGLSLVRLAPFREVELGGESSEGTVSRLMLPLSLVFYGLLSPLGRVKAPPIYHRMKDIMDGRADDASIIALKGVKVFPPGYLIGYAVFSNLHNTTMQLSDFS